MLIEMMEMNGIQVVSGNTDGIVCYFPENKEEIYKKVCKEWEDKVGNHTMGKLEYTDFTHLYQEDINSYIGRKIKRDNDNKIVGYSTKKKGRFLTELEMNKNKSKRIIALALEAYFIDGKDPIEFITNHKNIFNFCIGKKASRKLYYEELGGKIHDKIIRYYVSKEGSILKKRGINNEGNPMDNHCEAINKDFPWLGQPKITCFNIAKRKDDYNINYSYYILQTLKKIDAIEKTKKAKYYAEQFKEVKQSSLF